MSDAAAADKPGKKEETALAFAPDRKSKTGSPPRGKAPKHETLHEPVDRDEFGLPFRPLDSQPVVPQEEAEEEEDQGISAVEDPPRVSAVDGHSTPEHNSGKKAEDYNGSAHPNGSRDPSDKAEEAHPVDHATPQSVGPSTIGEAISAEKLAHNVSAAEQIIKRRSKNRSVSEKLVLPEHPGGSVPAGAASEWSHQLVVPQETALEEGKEEEDEWQSMPAYAAYDIYDDDGKLIAREALVQDEEAALYGKLGGAGKGYTRVNMDEDAKSASSMDENTKYLFKEAGTHLAEEGEDAEARDALTQLQATKDLLTEQQRMAYVAVVRIAMVLMLKEMESMEGTKTTKKEIRAATEALRKWGQKAMVKLYAHMEISSDEQVMIEQLADHGVEPGDLTPTLMQNACVKISLPDPPSVSSAAGLGSLATAAAPGDAHSDAAPLSSPHEAHDLDDFQDVQSPTPSRRKANINLDLRWTVLCDLFLVLIADSSYDARSRALLERVGSFMDVSWLEICKFEKRVTDALEMQEEANKENWNEDDHMENRRKMAIKRRIMVMGLATVGGGLVIGLSAGLLAPVIGAGLAAGFTTIGVAGTSGFLAGAGGAAVITTTGVFTGGAIAVKSASRRMGSVKTFEYRPLHNNKRANLIVTVSGWMTGKIDDVRLPYSTVDSVMGDIYSVLWEPEMLQSMGQTINILATEALTQGLQQVLGSTVLVALMASLQLPMVLTKLSYLIDNPWTVSLDRANAAGLILADSLIDRNLGVRPVTLVGFSLGSRMIFSCLKELAARGAYGLVQNVYLFGSPIVAKKDEYLRARSVTAGRFVNGYAKNDWILGYLFRATSGGIMRVAGLAPIDNVPRLENIDVTEFVPGHMAYRAAMPRLLREVGWSVLGDEFAEIEDADPDNHQERQREIIAEIDEARKELEKEPKKRRFGIFMRNKKLAQKKEWETYDETRREDGKNGQSEYDPNEQNSNALFDIDAIRAELASEQIQVREIESTLPPMKLEIGNFSDFKRKSSGLSTPTDSLQKTRSLDGGSATGPTSSSTLSSPSLAYHGNASSGRIHRAEPSPIGRDDSWKPRRPDQNFYTSHPSPSIYTSHPSPSDSSIRHPTPSHIRPEIKSSASLPTGISRPGHNIWLDEEEEEFGTEKEITLSFE